MKRRAEIWRDPPELAIPNNPAFVSDCKNAWIAYETASSDENIYAVVHFGGVIDMHLSPINDEGLGSHPYASFGLRFYEFNELFGTAEAKRWASLGVRHFVITFKDVTIDVVARTASVIAEELRSEAPGAAIQFATQYSRQHSG